MADGRGAQMADGSFVAVCRRRMTDHELPSADCPPSALCHLPSARAATNRRKTGTFLQQMKPQVYTDPRPSEHFQRFHDRVRDARPNWVYQLVRMCLTPY